MTCEKRGRDHDPHYGRCSSIAPNPWSSFAAPRRINGAGASRRHYERIEDVRDEVSAPTPAGRGKVRASLERGAPWAPSPTALLFAAAVFWCAVFGMLVYLRHSRFGSHDLDMGIYDQALWLVSRGHHFMTVRGLNVFGQHASIGFYLLAPFSWLGAGPHFLNILQVVSLGLGAVAVFHIARFHLRNEWLSLGLAVAFLLHPSIQWFAWELFHPEVIAIAPLLFAYLAALHRRWYWFLGLAAFAMSWKEDVALAVAVLGFVLLVRKEWRVGGITIAGALLWFLVATQVLVATQGDGVFYARQFYGDFGSTGPAVARTVVMHPTRVISRLQDANALGYAGAILLPFGLASLMSPLTLLIGLPQALFNLISVHSFTWDTHLHYAAMPVTAATLATVEGTARARGTRLRALLVAIVLISACVSTVTSGTAPVSARYRTGIWPLQDNDRQALLEAAIKTPPGDAVVSASYNLVPHLTHRRGIFTFPNPWILTNFGQANEKGPNPLVVQWLVVDRRLLGPEPAALLQRLIGTGEFRIVSDIRDVVVATRG